MLAPSHRAQLLACEALVMGASAGAIEALNQLLPAVPAEARIPVVVVVHLPANRPSLLVEVFAPRCSARVREPEDKEADDRGHLVRALELPPARSRPTAALRFLPTCR